MPDLTRCTTAATTLPFYSFRSAGVVNAFQIFSELPRADAGREDDVDREHHARRQPAAVAGRHQPDGGLGGTGAAERVRDGVPAVPNAVHVHDAAQDVPQVRVARVRRVLAKHRRDPAPERPRAPEGVQALLQGLGAVGGAEARVGGRRRRAGGGGCAAERRNAQAAVW
ncbi:MAG: hypothetical protein BJ554DRAFT_5042 [Olpidium bornovanus]|uniref:Uncharacterized protein n=1 Tax=Olpidium bornovanus TaxID=278681 RepID=A0A8H7ZLX7_9FUNG|nr:MAG: hypothetical protein BJ554DRAFT_5042 [Olpidium bornovanus]